MTFSQIGCPHIYFTHIRPTWFLSLSSPLPPPTIRHVDFTQTWGFRSRNSLFRGCVKLLPQAYYLLVHYGVIVVDNTIIVGKIGMVGLVMVPMSTRLVDSGQTIHYSISNQFGNSLIPYFTLSDICQKSSLCLHGLHSTEHNFLQWWFWSSN